VGKFQKKTRIFSEIWGFEIRGCGLVSQQLAMFGLPYLDRQ